MPLAVGKCLYTRGRPSVAIPRRGSSTHVPGQCNMTSHSGVRGEKEVSLFIQPQTSSCFSFALQDPEQQQAFAFSNIRLHYMHKEPLAKHSSRAHAVIPMHTAPIDQKSKCLQHRLAGTRGSYQEADASWVPPPIGRVRVTVEGKQPDTPCLTQQFSPHLFWGPLSPWS